MTKLRILQMLAAALLFSSPAFACPKEQSSRAAESTNVAQAKSPPDAENAGTPGMSDKTSPAVSGKSSGPAAGTNVEPSKAPEAGGSPGKPGMPGNKSGPAANPSAGAPSDQKNNK